MNDSKLALKEPMQQVLRDFAYLDLEVCPCETPFQSEWALNCMVRCGGKCGGTVALFVRLELAIETADNLLGTESDFRQQIDTMSELTNVLAGSAYEIHCNGLRPSDISIPKLLSPHSARCLWNDSPAECRYLLRTERRVEGGLLVALPREWSTQWK